jgi:hypothetical protein
MLRCGVVEDPEDQIVRFYGALRREIQDIVDYKEYHSIQRLFHLSMLTEKELQSRQQRRSSTFAPYHPPAPAKASSSSDVRTSTSSSTSGTHITGTRQQQVLGAFGCCSKTCYDHLFHRLLLRHQVPPLPGTWPYTARLPQKTGIHCYW